MASWSSLAPSAPSVSYQAALQTPIFLMGPLKSPPAAFRIWSMMQIIDSFFSFSLLRACYCIFSRSVSAQRLSIVSWCDQTIGVDMQVNKQTFEPYLSPSGSTGELLPWNQNGWRRRLPPLKASLSPPSCPALQSSILFSLAQSCSVVHECQLSAASALYLSLPLPRSLSLSLPPSLLISLP